MVHDLRHVIPGRAALRGGETVIAAGLVPAAPQLGQAQVRGEFPAAVPDRVPGPGGVAGKGDGIPGELGRIAGAVAGADEHAGPPQPGEEILLAAAAAAAVLTCRRSATRGASSRPRRVAFSDSARDGQRAAVRSPGAVDRSPYRCSAARQASRTRYRSLLSRGRRPSWRASIATRWMWSSPCRIATQRTALSSSPNGARPVRCITSQAICAHSSSDSVLSSGAARIEQCHTGRANPHVPIAACGWFSSPNSRRKSRLPSSRSGGSSSAGCRQPATMCGSVCSSRRPGPYR